MFRARTQSQGGQLTARCERVTWACAVEKGEVILTLLSEATTSLQVYDGSPKATCVCPDPAGVRPDPVRVSTSPARTTEPGLGDIAVTLGVTCEL